MFVIVSAGISEPLVLTTEVPLLQKDKQVKVLAKSKIKNKLIKEVEFILFI
jgi:hypothetical protein